MFTKLKILGFVPIASFLIFQALDVHGWWWSSQYMEKNIYGLDLVVVVIASVCLLFVLVCFYSADNNVCLSSPRNICTWVVNMDFTSWVSNLVFVCKEQ